LITDYRVVKGQQLHDLGMNLIHNVGKGAESEPRCITAMYKGNPDSDECDIALVGKGVTYDTGGLNIKPTGFMEEMYGDKGGSCAVIGALAGTLEMKPKKNILFACGFAENAVDAKSYKPSDIIKSMKGSTVNVGNTDAEGRLVLADCFTYVQQEFKPKQMIDLATLTGAAVVALGNDTAAAFGKNKEMVDKVIESGEDVFEPIWHLPIKKEHRDVIKTPVADLNNIGSTPYGGAS
jgi:leucyl aminopeptidase